MVKVLVGLALFMLLMGFNEFYALFLRTNWMHFSFFLMSMIAMGIIIKVFAKT